MGYAEVSVNAPAAQRRTFSYAIPQGLNVQPGQAVWVPFGVRLLQGIVVELSDTPAVEQTRDIAGVIDPLPLLTPKQLTLAHWISDYYLSPLFEALATMLPPGFQRRLLTFLKKTNREYDPATHNETQQHIIKLVMASGRVGLKEFEKLLGKKKAQTNIAHLVRLGLLEREYELERVRIKPKQITFLRLLVTPAEAVNIAHQMSNKRAHKQSTLLLFLAEQSSPVSLPDARKRTGCDSLTANALVKKGLIAVEVVAVRREPVELQNTLPSLPFELTNDQQSAFQAIKTTLQDTTNRCGSPGKVFLLHGVTGSGKTEVYLQALAEAVKTGKRAIVLVPEIALTPQTIERFSSRFPDRVAILHSRLSPGEQYDEWQRIKNGEADVVIGPRSAVFAPQPDLGLIIIDEEHEWTYKQHEQSPHYRTRDVAIKMSELTGCTVVLGSATQDVETYYHATRGEYTLLQLPERVVPVQNAPMPHVNVIDMRQELKEQNRSIFSRALSESIDRVVGNHEQAILFLNRRGMSTYVQCRTCGFVIRCRRCEVPLTYHLDTESLLCHQCNYSMPVPQICPNCRSRRIRYLGIGTEKLEQEVKLAFPTARVLRWDSDVTRGRYAHQKILDKFRAHDADILIGTQMVAKGLDLPLVTLVGVINADLSLNLPDFRAGERTYQLLSQVAGRAGRGLMGSQVIIQTYNPEHYAIKAAASHNYNIFYQQEIEFRRQLREPPFTRLAALTYAHTNDMHCQEEAERVTRLINEERDAIGLAGLDIVGPAPAYLRRIRGRYRWQIILRGAELSTFLARITLGQGWMVDIDPVGV